MPCRRAGGAASPGADASAKRSGSTELKRRGIRWTGANPVNGGHVAFIANIFATAK